MHPSLTITQLLFLEKDYYISVWSRSVLSLKLGGVPKAAFTSDTNCRIEGPKNMFTLTLTASLGVPKTTLRVKNSLEGLRTH